MSPPAPSDLPILPDEVTEDILVRLDAAADVARAAIACRSHLRVVRDRRFLLRLRRSLRPPPVLGFLSTSVRDGPRLRFHRPKAGHGGAAAARAVARAGDFSFSFLPRDAATFTDWSVRDVRDGRVLLSRRRLAGAVNSTFLDLAVADPLHRRYVLIPTIPDELVLKRYSAEMGSEPFFAVAAAAAARKEDDDDGEVVVVEEEMGSQFHFQVIYNWMSQYKIDTFVFSSVTGKWRGATSFSLLPSRVIQDPRGMARYHVGNCFYWVHNHYGHALVLDELEMRFSLLALPFPDMMCKKVQSQGIAVFDAGEHGLGLIVIRFQVMGLEMYCKKKNDGGGGAEEEWRRHKLIPYPEPACGFTIVAATEGCLMLEGTTSCSDDSKRSSRYFTLDLKTFLAERWFIPSAKGIGRPYLYANYPPLLSPPSI